MNKSSVVVRRKAYILPFLSCFLRSCKIPSDFSQLIFFLSLVIFFRVVPFFDEKFLLNPSKPDPELAIKKHKCMHNVTS